MRMAEESLHVTDSGERITGRREALHMTIEQLAAEAGVNADTLSDWERGRRKPRGSTVEAITKALERLETEMGVTSPAPAQEAAAGPQMVTIRAARGDVDVVVEGPIGDLDALAALVERLLDRPTRRDEDQGKTD